MRRIRRLLSPVRSGARRAQARIGDLSALLHTPRVAVDDIRWVAKVARERGEHALADEALFSLVQLGKATAPEQRQVRRLVDQPATNAPAAPAAAGAADPTGAAAEPSGSPHLIIWRDAVDGPLHAMLTIPQGGAKEGQSGNVAVWQPAWAELPRSLADQLAVGVLTRVARRNDVSVVRATDPWTAPLAAAVVRAVAASRTDRLATPSSEKNA